MALDVFIIKLLPFWNEVIFMAEKFIFWFVLSSLVKVQIARTHRTYVLLTEKAF